MPDSTPQGSGRTSVSSSPTVAILDLNSLAHNVEQVRRRIPPDCEIVAVVKADAYGHGAVPITQALQGLNVRRFGVSSLEEGLELRRAGVRDRILVMGALMPEELPEAVAHALTPLICDRDTAERLVALSSRARKACAVHIKVDTGMSRLGLTPEEVPDLLQSPSFRGLLRVEGLMTHLADADNPDSEFTQVQIRRFQDLAGRLKAGGLKIPLLHAANSSAVLRYPDAHGTAVRPGLMLYGYHMTPHAADAVDLRPVLSFTTRVVQVRTLAPGQAVGYNRTWSAPAPARLAVLPVGYADGYSRALSNRGAVLLHGVQAGIIGRVCMDFTMVDITRVPQVRPGDEAVLIGRQGTEHLSAHDLAAWMGTIPYEVLCTLGQRVARRYLPASPLTVRKSR